MKPVCVGKREERNVKEDVRNGCWRKPREPGGYKARRVGPHPLVVFYAEGGECTSRTK